LGYAVINNSTCSYFDRHLYSSECCNFGGSGKPRVVKYGFTLFSNCAGIIAQVKLLLMLRESNGFAHRALEVYSLTLAASDILFSVEKCVFFRSWSRELPCGCSKLFRS